MPWMAWHLPHTHEWHDKCHTLMSGMTNATHSWVAWQMPHTHEWHDKCHTHTYMTGITMVQMLLIIPPNVADLCQNIPPSTRRNFANFGGVHKSLKRSGLPLLASFPRQNRRAAAHHNSSNKYTRPLFCGIFFILKSLYQLTFEFFFL